jgi:hypothetical protein
VPNVPARRNAPLSFQNAPFRFSTASVKVRGLVRGAGIKIQPSTGRRLFDDRHGNVVLDGAGAIVLDNLAAAPPMPPLPIYAPSDSSTAADWRDLDGPDDPYRL